MPRQRVIVNGYSLPWGGSGIAVRRACEIVLSNPGVPQHDLMMMAAKFANISTSNSSWIVSPGEKSPAMRLWTRQKVGKKFLCYPNEFTKEMVGAEDAKRDEWMRRHLTFIHGERIPAKGDLVEVKQHRYWNPLPKDWHHALFIHWVSKETVTASTLEELGKMVDYNFHASFTFILDGQQLTVHSAKVRVCK